MSTGVVVATTLVVSALAASVQHPLNNNNNHRQRVLRCKRSMLGEDGAMLAETLLDVWSMREDAFDVLVSSDQQLDTLTSLLTANVDDACSVWIEDVEEMVAQLGQDPQSIRNEISNKNDNDNDGDDDDELAFFRDYRSFDDIVKQLESYVSEFPSMASLKFIGTTHEGRHLPVLRIMTPTRCTKKVIWFNGGIHAREWISSHTAMFLIHQLLHSHARNASQIPWLDRLDIHIAPHINPDGYEYSRSSNRLWRKNRRLNSRDVYGVDLNRNFPFHWGERGASRSPYSETYGGPSAASEPEVKALVSYISSIQPVAGIDFHSYGQLILRPWGWTYTQHPLESVYKKLCDTMRDVIRKASKKKYTSERSVDLYPASGGLDDWMTSIGMAGFTVELRDTGTYGFVLPKEEIVPTGNEIWEAFQVFCKYALEQL